MSKLLIRALDTHDMLQLEAAIDLVENAFADPCTLTNPGTPSVTDVKALYTAAYYG